MNSPAPVPGPPGVVTTTSLTPAVPAGVTAVIEVESTNTKLVTSVVPMVTLDTPVKFFPVMVTLVPPASGPLAGVMLVTVGTDAACSGLAKTAKANTTAKAPKAERR